MVLAGGITQKQNPACKRYSLYGRFTKSQGRRWHFVRLGTATKCSGAKTTRKKHAVVPDRVRKKRRHRSDGIHGESTPGRGRWTERGTSEEKKMPGRHIANLSIHGEWKVS